MSRPVSAVTGMGLEVVPAHRPAPGLEWVDVDGEVVAWVAERGELHHLDPIGSLVFLLCDGQTPLRTTVEELAVSFAQPVERVEEDVLGLVATMVRDGLLTR